MYTISNIPTVFITKSAINQGLLPFLAAFQRAIPFQISDQIAKSINRVKNPAGIEENSITLKYCSDIINAKCKYQNAK